MKVNLKKLMESIKGSNITIEKHPTEELYIYGYYKHPLSKTQNQWNNYSVMCRGLILDNDGNIIERAFDKFWTFRNHITENLILLSEDKIIKLPNSRPKIYEKLDGTMGLLYWINDVPYIATQRSFSSLKAKKGSDILQKKYFNEAQKLNKNYSYIFEIIYPEASLVVNYGVIEDLVLIGVIDKLTGESINEISDFGFKVKKDLTEYFGKFNSLNEIEEANISNIEGVVLEYNNLLRIKIKFPWYKEVHKELQTIINSEFQILESIKTLRNYYNYKDNPLSTSLIEKSLKENNNDISYFLDSLNINQIDHSAIQWTERHLDFYKKNNYFIEEFFKNSVEFNNTPDDRIWEWKKRYLDKFYD